MKKKAISIICMLMIGVVNAQYDNSNRFSGGQNEQETQNPIVDNQQEDDVPGNPADLPISDHLPLLWCIGIGLIAFAVHDKKKNTPS